MRSRQRCRQTLRGESSQPVVETVPIAFIWLRIVQKAVKSNARITTSPNGVILTWSNDTCTIIPAVHLRWLVLLENLGWIVNEAGHYTTPPVGDQVIANFAPLAAIHNLV